MLFVRHPDLLKRLVAVLLCIPLKSINEFIITNTEMPPEEIGKKFCRLDINMIVNGKRINIEIQVHDEGNYPERVLFQWARLYSSALPSGSDYALLPKTIIISILGFKLFDCKEVHSEIGVMEVTRHTLLTDKLGLHFFELPKLKDIGAIDMNSEKDLWLALFNAETEEELEKLSQSGGAVMSEAIQAYHSVTATDEFKNLEWMRRKTSHIEATALGNARRKEAAKWQGVTDALTEERNAALAEVEMLRSQLAKLQSE